MLEVDPSKSSSCPRSQAPSPTPADNSPPTVETFKKSNKPKARLTRARAPNSSKEDFEALLETLAQVEPLGANHLAEVAAKYAELQIKGATC